MDILLRMPWHPLHYSVEIITPGRGEGRKNKLAYRTHMRVKDITLKGNYIIHAERSALLPDSIEERRPMDELLLISSAIMEKLRLEVSDFGEIKKVRNLKEVQNKWREIRYKIENTYTGNSVGAVLDSMESKVMDAELLARSLSRDVFFQAYFGTLFDGYETDTGRERTVRKQKDGSMEIQVKHTESDAEKKEGQPELLLEGSYRLSNEAYITSIRTRRKAYRNNELLHETEVKVQLINDGQA